MKTILRLSLLLALLGGFTPVARAADRAGIQGILISASNEPGETDRRLARYEPTLRRILRFESFRHLGENAASYSAPDDIRLSLGQGHQLAVQVESSDGRSVHVRVQWTAHGRTLMNTGLSLRPGVPAVLGGPATGRKGEVYAVILIAG